MGETATSETQLIYLVLCKNGVEGDGRLSRKHEDKDLDLEMQLKLLNKPAVKSIKTKYGDIYDCVDITKQSAFDHPLLRNHTIQMKRSSFSIGMINKELLESKPSKIGVKSIMCPPRTVFIRRTQKEDIIRAKSQVRRYPGIGNAHQLNQKSPGYHFATFELRSSNMKYYGAKLYISIDQPMVFSSNQFSEAVLWVENGPTDQLNSIQVGWTVNPKLFGDNRTWVFSYWTADGFHTTGCFNLLCPGFVQVSCKKPLGFAYPLISVYRGKQYEDEFFLLKDSKSGNWWFVSYIDDRQEEPVGYWPSTLFTTLRDSASMIASGGEVYSPTSESSPTMGKGLLPIGNLTMATAARKLQFVDEKNSLVDPDASLLKLQMDSPACYKVESLPPYNENWINIWRTRWCMWNMICY
ncbi:uncharacterized protein LOC122651151 [Telopea speciosissima]|uniref:uncharacterized protein LOC122651151 n=1 Tax=Telopea speciosissima TaxID=54955 RepID=UPI001CC5BF52|nr:uncharacterized protein LOC122651151 [Telopea speciosissima]